MFKIFNAMIIVLLSEQTFSGIVYCFWICSTCNFISLLQILNIGKQNQADSDGDSGGKMEKLSRLSEDAFDSAKVSAKRPSNYMVLK